MEEAMNEKMFFLLITSQQEVSEFL